MIDSTVDIGVLGGGIAGLAAAIALRQAGFRCTVYEQAPELSEVGLGIQLSPNATRQLELLGLGDALRAAASRPGSLDVLRWRDGRLLARTPLGAECESLFGAPYYSLLRADLQRALLGALGQHGPLLDHQCTGVRPGPGSVELTFANGTRQTKDVVLGADGIHSVARAVLSSDLPRSSGQFTYRGLAPADELPALRDDPRVRGWFGPRQHCVCYPVAGGGKLSFTAMVPATAVRATEQSEEDSHAVLADAYGEWDLTVRTLLSHAESISRGELCDRDPLTSWTHGKLALLGDAAHPMLPFRAQGANQAIEDAVVLAGCLRTGDDVPDALRRYVDIRQPRANDIQRCSRDSAQAFHLGDGDRQLVRDENMPEQWALANQEWLFGYRAELAATRSAQSVSSNWS